MKLSIGKIIACGAVALAGLTLTTSTVFAAAGTINNDAWLRSTDGQPIFTHSGYIAKFGSTYYYYGEQYVGSQTYYQNGTHPTNNDDWVSTNVYTSTDLINWTPRVVAFNGGTYVQTGDWVGRCWGVLFNAATNRYVNFADRAVHGGPPSDVGGQHLQYAADLRRLEVLLRR